MSVSDRLVRVLLLAVLSVLIALNMLYYDYPLVGLPVSLVFFAVASAAVGDVFFPGERGFFRATLGFAGFVVVVALVGSVMIILGHFSYILSLGMIVIVGMVFGVLSLRVKTVPKQELVEASPETPKSPKREILGSYFGIVGFSTSAITSFYFLMTARTGEGGASVWLAIPNYFLVSFFAASLLLVFVLFFTRVHVGLKLSLVFVYSFLARSLFLIVWYPGRYGDPWTHLGRARFVDKTGEPYAYSYMLSNSLYVELVGSEAQYALVVLMNRMFSVDIYWVHVVLVPLLWSFLVPLFSYKLAELLLKKPNEKFLLITALVATTVSDLIAWGSVSVANSLGFIFFLFSVVLMLYWMRFGGRRIWALSLLAASATALAHLQPGILAVMFLGFVTVFQKVRRTTVKVVAYALLFVTYPLALYLADANFSIRSMLRLESLGAFQSDFVTVMVFFGLLGLVLSARGRYVVRRTALLVFVFYLTVVLEYYLTMYGMINLPFGASRILVMADLLLLPFIALGVMGVADALSRLFSSAKMSPSFVKNSWTKSSPRIVAFALIGLALSAQATLAMFQAYPSKEIVDIQPAAYEMEAIYFINSTAPGPYVVLGDPQIANLAIGLLGIDYGYAGGMYGLWGIPDFNYPTIKMYTDMLKSPSISYMKEAIDFTGWAHVAYFVLSMKGARTNFDRALAATKAILPVEKSFGDGNLYVFKYPQQAFEGVGPNVKVVFNDGQGGELDLPTRVSYLVPSEANSTVTLTGYNSYNVTEFPRHWAFLDLIVNNVSNPSVIEAMLNSSDVNRFVYVSGLLPSDVLAIRWLSNSNYPNVGWKEDSFRNYLNDWHTHELYRGTMVPTISSDGNVLSMSYSFTPNSYWYYYYARSVNIATNDYPYLLMRWKSNQPVAVAAVYYELGGVQEIVSVGSSSAEWSSIVVPLQPNSNVRTVMVGITNLKNQRLSVPGTLEIDYIIFASQ